MKRITIFSILLLAAVSLFAQGAKIGYIQSDTVLISMPEYEGAKTAIETYSSQLSAQLTSKGEEFEEKAQEFEKNASSGAWADAIIQDKRDELVRLENNIREFQQQAEANMRNKENEVLGPLYVKIQAAITAVAKSEGYDYVTPQQVYLYANDEHDLTDKVIAKLGGTKPGN